MKEKSITVIEANKMTEQNSEIRMKQLESKVEKMWTEILTLRQRNIEQGVIIKMHKENFDTIRVALEDNLGIIESQRKAIEELNSRFKNHINNESHNH